MENAEQIEKVAHIEERAKSNTKRLDEHEIRLDNLEKTYSIMEKMDYRMGNVEKTVEKMDKKLDEVDKEKGKKWDKLVDYIFYAVLGCLLGYIAVQLGLK